MPTITSIAPTQQHNGATLTITGTGFVAPAKVNFGSRSVTGTVASSTSVTCTVPTLCAGSYAVSVTQGTQTSNSVPFYYIGIPDCSALSAGSGPLAPAALDIYGSSLSTVTAPGGGVTFGAAGAGTAVTVVDDSHITVIPPDLTATPPATPTETVDVTVTTSGGTSFPAGAAAQFTYYNPPTVTAVSASLGTAAGNPVTATGTNFESVSDVTFFDGTNSFSAAGFTVSNDTGLTATIPSGLTAGTAYDVRVLTPGGLSAVNAPADQITAS